jgi:hypothetical protein
MLGETIIIQTQKGIFAVATRSKMRGKPSSSSTSPTIDVLRPSFQRSLLAQNKSPKTVKTYLEALDLFQRFLVVHGMPLAVSSIRREHAESFIADLLAHWRPNTANNRYRGCNNFSNGVRKMVK